MNSAAEAVMPEGALIACNGDGGPFSAGCPRIRNGDGSASPAPSPPPLTVGSADPAPIDVNGNADEAPNPMDTAGFTLRSLL